MAFKIVKKLKEIARERKMIIGWPIFKIKFTNFIVVVIHQPNSRIFKLFDRCTILLHIIIYY